MKTFDTGNIAQRVQSSNPIPKVRLQPEEIEETGGRARMPPLVGKYTASVRVNHPSDSHTDTIGPIKWKDVAWSRIGRS
jgi:hypothetical protein